MIGNKLADALRTRFFTGILFAVCMILLIISYLLSKDRLTPTSIIGLILFIVCGIFFILGFISIIRDEGISPPKTFKKQFEIDQRGFFTICGVILILVSIIYRYLNAAIFSEPIEVQIINLWIACGIISFITAIQAVFQKRI